MVLLAVISLGQSSDKTTSNSKSFWDTGPTWMVRYPAHYTTIQACALLILCRCYKSETEERRGWVWAFNGIAQILGLTCLRAQACSSSKQQAGRRGAGAL